MKSLLFFQVTFLLIFNDIVNFSRKYVQKKTSILVIFTIIKVFLLFILFFCRNKKFLDILKIIRIITYDLICLDIWIAEYRCQPYKLCQCRC